MGTRCIVLLADADSAHRRIAADALSALGHRVLEAEVIEQALKAAQENRPTAAFVDAGLGNERLGLDLIGQLNKSLPRICLCVLAARSDESLLLDSMRAGARDFAVKPLTAAVIESIMRRFVENLSKASESEVSPEHISRASLELEVFNSAAAVDAAVKTLLQIIGGGVSQRVLCRLELGLHEVLRNAYEHGNLGVTYDEKHALCEAGVLEERLETLSQNTERSDLRIKVLLVFENGRFECTVEDKGPGFDWRNAPVPVVNPDEGELRLHGRGLLLIRQVFDEVRYNDRGNAVTLIKDLSKSG